MNETTRILRQIEQGDPHAAELLLLYDALLVLGPLLGFEQGTKDKQRVAAHRGARSHGKFDSTKFPWKVVGTGSVSNAFVPKPTPKSMVAFPK